MVATAGRRYPGADAQSARLGRPIYIIAARSYLPHRTGSRLGVRNEKHVDRTQSITHKTGRKLDFVIIGVLVTALGISVYLNFSEDVATVSTQDTVTGNVDQSIAVLPFANRSASENDQFFVDGMHDDLLTQLAKISALKVISRTSVMQYRDTTKTMRDIGKELGVTTLLEGGVQRAGDRIRINVQLIDAETDEHIWAETYNRELTASNIFEIQEQIASEIAGALQTALSPEEQILLATRPTDNLEAYEAYMIGRQLLASRNTSEVREAIVQFEKAIQLDERFTLAYVALAESHMIISSSGAGALDEMLRTVRPLVAKARELDGSLGEVYNVMGAVSEYERDFQTAEQLYRKAIELSPGYTVARHWLALLLVNYSGRYEEAEEIYRLAVELDPLAANVRANLSWVLGRQGKVDEALQVARKSLAVNPGMVEAYENIGELLVIQRGEIATGMQWMQKSAALDPLDGFYTAWAFLVLGDSDTATAWVKDIVERHQITPQTNLSMLLAVANRQNDVAIKMANQELTYGIDTAFMPGPLFVLRNEDLRQQEFDLALERYSAFFPDLVSNDPIVHRSNIAAAIDLIPVLRALERDDSADRLASRSLKLLQSTPGSRMNGRGTMLPEVYALMGNQTAAINALREIVDTDWVTYWLDLPDRNPNFELVHDDPEFIALLDEVKEKIADELVIVRDLIREGKLASSPEQLSGIEFDLDL